MSSQAPALSVLLVTYNHSAYIEEALHSIDMQDYDGAIDLIVCDDSSTDDTVAIIDRFRFSNPRIALRHLESESNMGITRNYQRAFAAATAEYVAVLEGDDRWTHPARLTKLVGLLTNHHELVMACNNYFIHEEDSHRFTSRTSIDPQGFWRVDSRYLILNNLPGNFSACVYRKSAIDKIPPALYELKSYDWVVNICVGVHGLIAYTHEPMSIYRLHSGGSWSALEKAEKLESQLEMVQCYNILTQGIYKSEFDTLTKTIHEQLHRLHLTPAFLEHTPLSRIKQIVVQVMPPFVIKLARLLVPPFVMNRIRGSL